MPKKWIFVSFRDFSGFSDLLTIFDNFWICGVFYGLFWIFFWILWIFLGFWIFWIFFEFLDFLIFCCWFFWIFLKNFFVVFLWFLSKLLRLLLNFTTITTGHQKSQKLGQNSIKSCFFARRIRDLWLKGVSLILAYF